MYWLISPKFSTLRLLFDFLILPLWYRFCPFSPQSVHSQLFFGVFAPVSFLVSSHWGQEGISLHSDHPSSLVLHRRLSLLQSLNWGLIFWASAADEAVGMQRGVGHGLCLQSARLGALSSLPTPWFESLLANHFGKDSHLNTKSVFTCESPGCPPVISDDFAGNHPVLLDGTFPVLSSAWKLTLQIHLHSKAAPGPHLFREAIAPNFGQVLFYVDVY